MIWKEKINMICSDDHFGLHGTIYSVYLSNRENGIIGLLEGVIEWIYIKCMEYFLAWRNDGGGGDDDDDDDDIYQAVY